MKITKEEFTSAHGSLSNSEDAFDSFSSVFIQGDVLGKTTPSTSSSKNNNNNS